MILKNLKNKKIILASKSPRRKELLEKLGLEFEVKIIDGINEEYPGNLTHKQIAQFLAEHKAGFYKEIIKENTVLITADTIVCTKNEILNKPKDFLEATEMLKKLSGKKHKVITGVCILSATKKKAFTCKTNVYFKKLSKKEIEYYIKNYMPYDKAGGYGIQEWIGYAGIKKIKGSFFNVVGLPVQRIYTELEKF